MPKIITIVGATGVQGGSVVRALLDNPKYTIRAVTRNVKSDAAQALVNRGVEVVEADLHDVDSLRVAFAGSHAIFAVTNFFDALPAVGVERAMEIETLLGANLADAAAATESLAHYVWSTLPNSRRNTGGEIVVPYYESKNRVDDYVKENHPQLLQKTTFFWAGWYAGNINYPWFKPIAVPSADGGDGPGPHIQLLGVSPSTIIPIAGDEKTNVGLFVRAILDHPEKTLPAQTVAGVVKQATYSEVAQVYDAARGTQVRCVQIPKDDYRGLWPVWGELMDVTNSHFEVMGRKAFDTADDVVLTKEDLEVEGLVGTAEAFVAKKHRV
ncbi:hscarg dehydrogenase [Apiospora saccharicola]|uniref:Hscarg dehydrogenase n=1 Tax=Apiospora saccharicola TaxID=335842 RepID=A0ABR1WK92_9PEZI